MQGGMYLDVNPLQGGFLYLILIFEQEIVHSVGSSYLNIR